MNKKEKVMLEKIKNNIYEDIQAFKEHKDINRLELNIGYELALLCRLTRGQYYGK